MVGNSLGSDIVTVVELEGNGICLPYQPTWSLDTSPDSALDNPRVMQVGMPGEIPAAIARLRDT